MSALAIGGREIGGPCAPYIIAEIGVNHDGDLERGRMLVQAAHASGADAVKLQLFDAVRLMSRDARFARYQQSLDAPDPRAMLQALELPHDAMHALVGAAKDAGMHAIVTVFSVELVAIAETWAPSAYKSASPDIVHHPLLAAMTETGRPLIVSTGAATMDEVRRANEWLRGSDTAFLQCVSSYPTPEDAASLGAIVEIARATERPCGYSDHTTALDSGALAVAAGAVILEKHLTYDRTAPGPDHAASLDPAGFSEYVRLARRAHRMLGSGKGVQKIEEDVRCVSRQSLVATRSLRAGMTLVASDVTCKRPGTGIAPFELEAMLGQRLCRDVAEDHVIHREDLTR